MNQAKTIVNHKVGVLDHGFVKVIDTLGDDSSIVQAARVSYGAGTKTVSEDRTLIHYLMRHRHTTPFEMCMIKLLIKCPMDVWRQWIRHRTAHVNEYSTRYSEAIDSMAETLPTDWRLQSTSNKQGSQGTVLGHKEGTYLSEIEAQFHNYALQVYRERLKLGVAREQARKDLPLSNYTEAYWMIDLHNLFHFLGLRMDSHAQFEIRSYANAIAGLVSRWVPYAYEAFREYRLDATHLSFTMKNMIHAWNTHPNDAGLDIIWNEAIMKGWIKPVPGQRSSFTYPRNRERDEAEALLHNTLGFPIWWRPPYSD